MTDEIHIRFNDGQRARMAMAAVDRLIERDGEVRVRFTPEQSVKLATMRTEVDQPVEHTIDQPVEQSTPRSTAPIRVKMTPEQAKRARIASIKARSSWWS